MARLILLAISALLVACSASAEPKSFAYFDQNGGRVRDLAKVMSPAAVQSLAVKLDGAEASYGPQMAIVTVPSLHNYSIEDFSLYYARAWGLGDHERNDGILLLVAPNERRVRIEIGKGIERTFTDVYCKEVIERSIIPHFKQGDLEGGIKAGADDLVAHMREHPTIPVNDNGASSVKKAA